MNSPTTRAALFGAAMLMMMASLLAAQGRGASAKTGQFTRLPDGKPDLQGYWETQNFFTAFNLETQDQEQFGIPAGKGVVVDPPDGKIPYQAWAATKRQDMVEHHMFNDPQAHCYL